MAKSRVIKKKWRPVYSLEPLKGRFIGEVYTAAIEDAIGRYILINLAAVTNNYSHQHFNIKFKIENSEGEKLYASVYGYFMQQAYEKRIVSRRREKISDSFAVKTKDEKLVVVKPILITTAKCPKSVETKIRKFARYYYASKAKEMNYPEFIDNIINGKLQGELRKRASKIMPIATSEIRKTHLVDKFSIVITPDQYKELFGSI